MMEDETVSQWDYGRDGRVFAHSIGRTQDYGDF